MLKRLLLCVLIVLLFASGCGGRFDLKSVPKLYGGCTQITAKINIVTNTGVLQTYQLDYNRVGEDSKMEIILPESLKGIRASISQGTPKLIFEDAAIETFLPSVSGYTPMDAMDGLIRDLSGSPAGDYSIEKYGGTDVVVLTYPKNFAEHSGEKRVWLDLSNPAILCCEFYLDGMMVMRLDVESIQVY